MKIRFQPTGVLAITVSLMLLSTCGTAASAHSDVFLANGGGQVLVGGAHELATVDEHFDLATRVFEGVMIPGFPPFAPADYGRDEPGFFALPGGDPRLPAGASALPAAAAVSLGFTPLTVGGNSDVLFYWDGGGTVDFQPISTTQPGVAMSLDSNPLDNTSADGGLHVHVAFKLDDGGASTPADGVYLVGPTASVAGLAASDPFHMLWLVDSLLVDEDAAEELEHSLELGETLVHGKDFAFFEEAVEYVHQNLVVPEPTSGLLGVLALAATVVLTRRQNRS